jgi:integrase
MTESVYEWKPNELDLENVRTNDATILYDNPLASFLYALKSSEARRQYPARLSKFFDFIEIENNYSLDIKNKESSKIKLEKQSILFLERAKVDEKWALNSILRFIDYLKTRQQRGEITAGTIKNYYRSIKLFCEMNDLSLRWRKITIGLPKSRDSSNDRAPTIEEIRRLVDYPDRRIKVIVSVMISSGIRLGAWDYLKWKNVIPILDEKGDTIAAKLIVYFGEPEEFFTFISPESFHLLKEWMEFRRSYGEKITEESWLMRDIWQTTNVKYGANWGLATIPKKLESVAIKRIIDRALRIQGIRSNLKEGQKRHEFKALHGFRKFFKSRSEQVMKPINVEILMGHSIGISDSYYRPQEKEILGDYLKATELLSINSESKTLKKQLELLEVENKNNQYIIKGKLQEKDKAIEELNQKYQNDINILKQEMETKFQQLLMKIDTNRI